ncbi:Acetate kinase [Defluviimonas aquaemixtae]|uniref:Acetate kinase n=1 Tax=Albidovulum aquaemixtae TaxID=1542388 RepID=A0A2R8B5X5_9RHOB|nr:acetate/propionate family kinase [Defluviimonas aquaemixtae]SPH18015.1 Acetate kinase [Defluviimonas aquaemixtae]
MILVVNAGSSSIKVALFASDLTEVLDGAVSGIGGRARLKLGARDEEADAPDHDAALALILAAIRDAGHPVERFGAAGHRVVHGGRALTRPARVDADVLAAIEACIPLAPLHNPHNLAPIRALGRLAPRLPQVACFDTAFHATNPEVAQRYALPAGEEAKGIRRYGFHGISYASLTARLSSLLGSALPERVLALHLGNGASLAAIRDGRSVATTMGYSPLEGLTMGTRTGTIDGNAVLRMAQDHGIDGAARILNRESGLKGLGGASDMRALHAEGTEEARFGIDHFCYWAVRHSGSMIAAMGGLDCIAFTGGIGENDAEVRARICQGLSFLGAALDQDANEARTTRLEVGGSAVPILIVPAEEERHIAGEVLNVLGQGVC